MSIPAGKDWNSSGLVPDGHGRSLPNSETFEEYFARAQEAFETKELLSKPAPSSLRRRRSYTPDWVHAANELSPDYGLLDDSQSEFDAIGRSPSPDAREPSVPPFDFRLKRQTFDHFTQRPAAPAESYYGSMAAELATYANNGYTASARPIPTELPSAPALSEHRHVPAPEGRSSHTSVGMPAQQRAHDEPDTRVRRKYAAQLRPVQSTRQSITASAETSSISPKRTRSKAEPSVPLRRSARLGNRPSSSSVQSRLRA